MSSVLKWKGEKFIENPSIESSLTKEDFFRNWLGFANNLDQGIGI